ncbi:MAG TPA: TrkA family potassium uptake protein [Spirochaetota bacterium]|nr:TrkA family potassium uptake protein [Spirochaetota bacterium]HNT09510.1 TrkA family potassium uptake protein [Spirochaetota bacterium]
MQKYAVIGLGNFGIHIAKSLSEYGSEVTGIDISQEQLLRARNYLKNAVNGDATDKAFLQTVALGEMDGVIVSVGGDMGVNVLITILLKEMGMKRLIACAYSEPHCAILEHLGVKDIVFPQRDFAAWFGKALSIRNVLDYVPLAGEYVVMNIQPPRSFIGKNIRDLQIGARFKCQILGIKYLQGNENWNADSPEWENMKIAPTADDIIPERSVLLFLGRKSDLLRIQQQD